MTTFHERKYLLAEAPGYWNPPDLPVIGGHGIAHVDFICGTIEIGEGSSKFDLRAFLYTAGTIARDLVWHHGSMKGLGAAPTIETWEAFGFKREELEKLAEGIEDG